MATAAQSRRARCIVEGSSARMRRRDHSPLGLYVDAVVAGGEVAAECGPAVSDQL